MWGLQTAHFSRPWPTLLVPFGVYQSPPPRTLVGALSKSWILISHLPEINYIYAIVRLTQRWGIINVPSLLRVIL